MSAARTMIFAMILGFCAGAAGAQNESVASLSTIETKAPVSPRSFKLIGGLNSWNTSARLYEYEEETGRRYRLVNEYSLGLDHQSGWGFYVMAVTLGTSFGESDKDKFGAGDPSLTISHPLFASRDVTVAGQYRYHFQATDRSKERDIRQHAYLLSTNLSLRGSSLFNLLITRYFDQAYYEPADTLMVVEDYTTYTWKAARWVKVGIGQHTVFERHADTVPGTSVDLYPLADFLITPTISFGPRIYFPVHRANAVSDAANAVAINNSQAELYLRLSI